MKNHLFRFACALVGLLSCSFTLTAQQLGISQVDTADLFLNGTVNVYASLSGADGSLIDSPRFEDFRVQELRANGQREALKIVDVQANAGQQNGLNVLLLVDNSGSMYDPFANGSSRIQEASKALKAFFYQFAPQRDRVGLGAFNTHLGFPAAMGSSPEALEQALAAITQPDRQSAYTELYTALARSLEQIRSQPGRRAVIVLSDGENFPFAKSGQAHPDWPGVETLPAQVIKQYQQEGVTLYAVNFADTKDADLAAMAVETGGMVFEARNADQLLNVYRDIQDRIGRELRLTVRVSAWPEFSRNLELSYQDGRDQAVYYAPLVLGQAGNWPLPVYGLAVALAIAGFCLLLFWKFERPAQQAELTALDNNLTIALNDQVTVIGSSPTAHLTLAGDPGIASQHATIVADPRTGIFTLVSDRTVRVNNKPTKKRVLAAGDVIRIEGSTIVFDEPARPGRPEKSI